MLDQCWCSSSAAVRVLIESLVLVRIVTGVGSVLVQFISSGAGIDGGISCKDVAISSGTVHQLQCGSSPVWIGIVRKSPGISE